MVEERDDISGGGEIGNHRDAIGQAADEHRRGFTLGCEGGEEVSQLAQDIIASVQQKFGIRLEPEVNII